MYTAGPKSLEAWSKPLESFVGGAQLPYLQMVAGTICLKGVNWATDKKATSEYFTQVQIAMRCTGRQWCDFVVWWPKGLFVTRISADTDYQDKVIQAYEATF